MSFEKDGYAPCCVAKSVKFKNVEQYLASDYLSDLKNDLQQGIQNPICNVCWQNEYNHIWSNRLEEEIKNNIISIHMGFSNTCNLKCHMCSPAFSTSLGLQKRKLVGKKYKILVWNTFNNKADKRYFYKHIVPNLKLICISGGEPFQCADHYEFLNVAYRINPKLSIFYNSNCTNLYFKKQYIPNFFNRYANVSVSPSIDGFGKSNDYQRQGSDWNTVSANMLQIKKHISEIHATPTIYTLFSLGDLFEWGINNNIEVGIYLVDQQSYLHPSILPDNIKTKFIKNISKRFADHPTILSKFENNLFKSLMLKSDVKNIDKFKKKTLINNAHSKTNFPDFVPELKEWFNSI